MWDYIRLSAAAATLVVAPLLFWLGRLAGLVELFMLGSCFVFPLQCFEPRWFLDVRYYVFLAYSCTFDVDIAIFVMQNLSFGRPGATWETIGRSKGTWGYKKRGLGAQAWVFTLGLRLRF